jgi:hypothetical protein
VPELKFGALVGEAALRYDLNIVLLKRKLTTRMRFPTTFYFAPRIFRKTVFARNGEFFLKRSMISFFRYTGEFTHRKFDFDASEVFFPANILN